MARIWLLVHIFSLLLVLMVFGCGGGGSPKLTLAGFKVEFAEHNLPDEMTVGQRLLAAVSFRNASARTWPSKPNSNVRKAVNLLYPWPEQRDQAVVFDGLRTPLSRDLSPRESVQLNAAIQAPEQLGRYRLEMTLVRGGVAWFPERDGDKIAVPVNMREAKAAGSEVGRALTTEAGGARSQSKKMPDADKPSESGLGKKLSADTPVQKDDRKARKVTAKKPKSTQSRQPRPWSVQLGSYLTAKEAQALVKRLKDQGYDAYVTAAEVQGKRWYRVRVGHLASKEEAERLQKKLIGMEGFKQALVTNRK